MLFELYQLNEKRPSDVITIFLQELFLFDLFLHCYNFKEFLAIIPD